MNETTEKKRKPVYHSKKIVNELIRRVNAGESIVSAAAALNVKYNTACNWVARRTRINKRKKSDTPNDSALIAENKRLRQAVRDLSMRLAEIQYSLAE